MPTHRWKSTTASAGGPRELLQILVVFLAALLAVLPLILRGCSCGHDFSFHLQNWMEVDAQWHAGILWPRWALHAAWNAGEPRLLFYPPLSWLLGAALGRILPLSAVPITYTFLALLLSGLTMRRLVERWTTPAIATLAACIYLANPYMLFVAYERTAFAELLAAAWMPLLLAAVLRARTDPLCIAIPIALLWLTNAPAAVVGCYALLLLGTLRLALMIRRHVQAQVLLDIVLRIATGTALGLALAAFYIVPAAYERRFVQISMAVIELMRPSDNFLFGHTPDAFHNQVLRTASVNAVGLLGLAFLCALLFLARQRRSPKILLLTQQRDITTHPSSPAQTRGIVLILTVFSAVILFLLTPVTAWIWTHAPELTFLQFPWRFLAVESGVTVILLALVLPATRPRLALQLALLIALCGGFFADHVYRQACDPEDTVQAQQHVFQSGTGTEPTDEYTPVNADNDALAHNNPLMWLANDSDAQPNASPQARPMPEILENRPSHLRIHVNVQPAESFLVMRLRAFRGWHVVDNGLERHNLPLRDDGLIAIPLTPAVAHTIVVSYYWTPDQWISLAISLAALTLTGALIASRQHTLKRQPRVSSRSADDPVL